MRYLLQLAFWLAFAGTAAADFVEFRSPDGNITCAIYSDKAGASARCDLAELVPSFSRPPQGCAFDWGKSFAVDTRGKGYLACVSDAVSGPGAAVLRFGQTISLGGVTCVSAETGMTCTNARGRGFSVAKEKQSLF